MGVGWWTLMNAVTHVTVTCVTVVFALNATFHTTIGIGTALLATISAAHFALLTCAPALLHTEPGSFLMLILTALVNALMWFDVRECLLRSGLSVAGRALGCIGVSERALGCIGALCIGTESRTTIFTAYFFGGLLYATRSTGPDMTQPNFLDGMPILIRFVIDVYEDLIEELLSQEKKKRQRALRGGR